MNRKYYNENDSITLKNEDHIQEFVICEQVGHGIMSTGYKAMKITPVGSAARLLVEFCPLYLDRDSAAYKSERKRFINTLRLRCELGNLKETVNQTAPFLDLYEDENTGALWAETTWINAEPLSSFIKSGVSLSSFFKTIKYLLEAVSGYHKKGYLMLSVKPGNVEVYSPGYGVEGVRILDFGNMIRKIDIEDPEKRDDALISFSPKWSAPEVYGEEFDRVSEKSDIYSIGLIVCSYLFEGELPITSASLPRHIGDKLKKSPVLKRKEESSAIAKILLKELLEGMLAYDPDDRLTDSEAIDAVNDILEEVTPKTRYVLDKAKAVIPRIADRFVSGSRDKEEALLLKAIKENRTFIVAQGPGGVGKSELLYDFINKYAGEYDFYHLTYNGESLLQTLLTLPLYPAIKTTKKAEDGQTVSMTEEELYLQIEGCLQEYGRETVIVIDNLDAPNDIDTCHIEEQAEFKKLTELPITVIATSRYDGFKGVTTIPVRENRDMCLALLKNYLPRAKKDDLIALIDIVEGNTLAVDIIGRTLSESIRFGAAITVADMLDALNGKSGFEGFEPVRAEYRRDSTERNIVEHLAAVFRISKMNDRAESVLRFAALFPVNGILKTLAFESITREEDRKCYKELVRTGWIKEKQIGTAEKVYLHPIVSTLVREKLNGEDSEPILSGYLGSFSAAFKKHVDDEIKQSRAYADLFAEDIGFAERIAGIVHTELNSTGKAPADSADLAAEVFLELSQHYYHLSDRSDLRRQFLTNAVDLMMYSTGQKSGPEKDRAVLDLARQVFYRGIACYNLDLFEQFLKDCELALSLLIDLNDLNDEQAKVKDRLMSQIHERVGELLLNQGDLQGALDNYDRAIEIAGRLDKEDIARAYRFKGIAYGDGGSLIEALRLFKAAIDNNDVPLRIYNCVGLYASIADLYDVSYKNYKRAYSCWEKEPIGSPIYLCINMANCCSELGKTKEAITWTKKTIEALFRDSGRETAAEVIKLLSRRNQEVNIRAEDPHWQGTLAAFVGLCALKTLCFRDGNTINRNYAEKLVDRAVSACDDSIRSLYHEIAAMKSIDESAVRQRASKLKFNKQTAAYLSNRIAEYYLIVGEYVKACNLALAGYQLNLEYNYPIGIADSADTLKKASNALSIPVSTKILEYSDQCEKKLESERNGILSLKDSEFMWMF